MFDFDGSDSNQVFRNTGNLQASEFNDRTVNVNFWTIQDAETVKRVELIPGSNDRLTDDGFTGDRFTGDFARWDVAVRQWEQLETNRWIWSARGEIGELFNDGKISIGRTSYSGMSATSLIWHSKATLNGIPSARGFG